MSPCLAHQSHLLQFGRRAARCALRHHEAEIRLARPDQIRRLIREAMLNRGEDLCQESACLKRWNGWISSSREMMSLAAMASVLINWAGGRGDRTGELKLVDGAPGAWQQSRSPAWVQAEKRTAPDA